MFDLLRNLKKSDAEKQQETLHAYLDGGLTPVEKNRFEGQLQQNADLQAEVAQLQVLKQQMRRLPQRRVPRNFMLDPQRYGRPKSAPLIQAYPLLRTATAFTAFFFVIALAANVFLSDFGGRLSAPVAMESAAPAQETIAEIPEEEAIEIFQEETEAFVAEEAPAEEERAMEEAAEALPLAADVPEKQQESAAANAEMPADMIAGTTEISEADAEAPKALETTSVAEEAASVDPQAAVPLAATRSENLADDIVSTVEPAEAIQNRDPINETNEQAISTIDPWVVLVFVLGVVLVFLLLLMWLARRRI